MITLMYKVQENYLVLLLVYVELLSLIFLAVPGKPPEICFIFDFLLLLAFSAIFLIYQLGVETLKLET